MHTADTQAPYHVSYIAAPVAALSDEQFRHQALAQVWAAGTQYLGDTIIAHRPAHSRLGQQVGAITSYTVQVWDLSLSTKAKPLGKFCLVAEAETAAECLSELATKLEGLELLALQADPTRSTDAQIASYLALASAA